MKSARWRTVCNPNWPQATVDWLRTQGSLTVRLSRTFGQFRVQVRFQGCAIVLADEARALRVLPKRQVRARDVTLWAGGEARVLAHTAVTWLGPQSDWPFWRQLGTRSLGTVLFRDRRVQRGALAFARLPDRHPLAQQASATSRNRGPWFARRAVYRRAAGRTPLLVTEVFIDPRMRSVRRQPLSD